MAMTFLTYMQYIAEFRENRFRKKNLQMYKNHNQKWSPKVNFLNFLAPKVVK